MLPDMSDLLSCPLAMKTRALKLNRSQNFPPVWSVPVRDGTSMHGIARAARSRVRLAKDISDMQYVKIETPTMSI